MNKPMILVTGAAGYVGSVLCRQLLAEGYRVRGLDILLFGGESLVDCFSHPYFEFLKGDLCDAAIANEALSGVDTVVHLAAIVGDPACKRFPEAASQLMDVGSRQLHALAVEAGLKHFIFASTCSNYGVMQEDQLLDESSPLNPQSHYARLKVSFEQFLQAQALEALPWTILRFATAYGHSPRPRFDLTVNHFTRDLSLGRGLDVFAADLWRPYCHVHDLARAAGMMIGKSHSAAGKVYNVGRSTDNFTKREIVAAIRKVTQEGTALFNASNGGDLRNYRVDFSRIKTEFGFEPARDLDDGILEIHRLVKAGILADPFSPSHQNS